MLLEVSHPALNSEVTAIGGYYVILKEDTLDFQNREVLYWVGCAVLNSSCCGIGGVSYAKVQGYVQRYRYKQDLSGADVSLVEPIVDAFQRKTIQQLLMRKEMIHQVEF